MQPYFVAKKVSLSDNLVGGEDMKKFKQVLSLTIVLVMLLTTAPMSMADQGSKSKKHNRQKITKKYKKAKSVKKSEKLKKSKKLKGAKKGKYVKKHKKIRKHKKFKKGKKLSKKSALYKKLYRKYKLKKLRKLKRARVLKAKLKHKKFKKRKGKATYKKGSKKKKAKAKKSKKHKRRYRRKRKGFKDVHKKDWFYKAVMSAQRRGLVKGVDDINFDPNGNATREAFTTVVYRVGGEESIDKYTDDIPFTDVSEDDWSYVPIKWAFFEKVVKGTSETTFSPKSNVTNEQIMTMLYRYSNVQGFDLQPGVSSLDDYPDYKDVSGYAEKPLKWAIANQIIQTEEGRFLPKSDADRAELIYMIDTYVDLIGGDDDDFDDDFIDDDDITPDPNDPDDPVDPVDPVDPDPVDPDVPDDGDDVNPDPDDDGDQPDPDDDDGNDVSPDPDDNNDDDSNDDNNDDDSNDDNNDDDSNDDNNDDDSNDDAADVDIKDLDVKPGVDLSGVTLKLFDGSKKKVSEYKGEGVLLSFFSTT